jgi:hypothetical protein
MTDRISVNTKLGSIIDGVESLEPRLSATNRPGRLPTKQWRDALLLSLLLDGAPSKPALRGRRSPGSRHSA